MGKSKTDDNGLLPGNQLPAHGPVGEGVDPLTAGQTTYGDDVKGASTHEGNMAGEQDIDDEPEAAPEVEETPSQDELDEKAEETVAAQEKKSK